MRRIPGLLAPLLLALILSPALAGTLEDLKARFAREKKEPFQTRYKTLQEIAALGSEEAVRFLVGVIEDDEDSSIRSNAVHQVARIPLKSAYDALIRFWENGDQNVRSNVLSALSNYRKEGLPAKMVDEILKGSDQNERSTLIRWLGKSGDPRFVSEAERFLSEFPTGGSSLISTLTSVKTADSARLILRAYDDTRNYDREQIPKFFTDATEEIQRVLVEALRGKDPGIVDNAISLVSRARVALAEPALVGLLAAAKTGRKAWILEAIGAVGGRTDEGQTALLAALGDKDDEIVVAGVRAFRNAPAIEAIPILVARMEPARGALRVEIRVTLEAITGLQYGDRADLWKMWWEEFGDGFSLDDVRKPDPNAVDTALVNLAIEKGAAALKSIRGKDKPWEYASHPVGTTALVCLALHASGLDMKDPDLRAGVEYLWDVALPNNTYDLGLVAMALESIDGKRFKRKILEAARSIISGQQDAGLWGYPTGDGDNSNTQYAALGLRSAARVGMRIPEKVWRALRDHFLGTRCDDLGWSYRPDYRTTSSSSMSAAGLSSLLICLENMKLDASDSEVLLAAIEAGYKALGEKMDLGKDSLYALYGIERAGILGRRQAMAGKEWYGPGAKRLVEEQDREGFWRDQYHPAVDTSFAILFLKKFTAPISTR